MDDLLNESMFGFDELGQLHGVERLPSGSQHPLGFFRYMLAGQHPITRRLRLVVGLCDFAAASVLSYEFHAGG